MLLSIISPWSTHSCNECDNKTKRDVNGGYWVKSWQRQTKRSSLQDRYDPSLRTRAPPQGSFPDEQES